MTIRFPKRTIADEVLDLVGKKRAYRIPGDPYKHGPYSYVMAEKEPFLKALVRSKSKQLPDGWSYFDDLPFQTKN